MRAHKVKARKVEVHKVRARKVKGYRKRPGQSDSGRFSLRITLV